MSQKTDKMLKLALVFFISLLSFSIGTFVGKKYSDNQHKLAALEPHEKGGEEHAQEFAGNEEKHEGAEHAEAATEGHGAPAKKDAALTDHEVAKIAEEFATDSNEVETATEKPVRATASEEKDIKEITVANVPKKALPTKTVETTTAAAHAPAAAKEMPAATHETTATATTSRATASIPPNVAKQYTVQVASFATAAEAQKLAKELFDKGFKSSSVAAQVNGQTWHRVQVGIFGSVKEAQDYKKDFLDKTHLTSAIVQPVQPVQK